MKLFKSVNTKIIYLLAALLMIIISFLLYNRSKTKPVTVSKDGFYFDTIINISIYDKDKETATSLINDCFSMCSEYENLFSKTIEGSDIYNINNANGKPVKIDLATMDIIKEAIHYAKESDAIVDPTVGKLSALWNINSDNFMLPSKQAVSEALNTVNYKNIVITDDSEVYLSNPDSMLDLGFIAKGYIADKLKEFLISKSVNSAIINLGGNVLTIGNKIDNNDFIIGINDPKSPYKEPLTTVKINDLSVVSSGDYERYKDIDNVRYHHILSTKNGYPAKSDLSQVTIISSSSTEGDALSTLCFILGYDSAKQYLEKYHKDVTAIFVDKDGNIIN